MKKCKVCGYEETRGGAGRPRKSCPNCGVRFERLPEDPTNQIEVLTISELDVEGTEIPPNDEPELENHDPEKQEKQEKQDPITDEPKPEDEDRPAEEDPKPELEPTREPETSRAPGLGVGYLEKFRSGRVARPVS